MAQSPSLPNPSNDPGILTGKLFALERPVETGAVFFPRGGNQPTVLTHRRKLRNCHRLTGLGDGSSLILIT